MNPIRVNPGLCVLLSLLWFALDVRGDGGVVRLRAVEGPFLITLFTAPELFQAQPADINILVQDRDSGDAILDAEVNLRFSPPGVSITGSDDPVCGGAGLAGLETSSDSSTVAATHRQASNKLFYAAPINFASAGAWRMQVSVLRQGVVAKIACRLPVGQAPHEVAGLIFYLCLPPLLVGLFSLNQALRTRGRGMGDGAIAIAPIVKPLS